jgi:DNA processing protein
MVRKMFLKKTFVVAGNFKKSYLHYFNIIPKKDYNYCMHKSDETLFCLGFSYFTKLNPTTFFQLISHFQKPSLAYWAKEERLAKLIGLELARKFNSFRRSFCFSSTGKYLEQAKIGYVSFFEDNYPTLLKQIPDPPIGLFYRGNYEGINWQKGRYLAIVGTRTPTIYGRRITKEWAKQLAKAGIVLVSGLALGIDTLVHQQAVVAKLPTVAVLGCGLNKIYPPQNRSLYWQIVDSGGLVVSEFPPEATVPKKLFTGRNRIISGLCQTTLLIEGTSKSGTLITARYALEQGREVLALPGCVDNKYAAAPLLMLKLGAVPANSAEEVLNSV